MNIIANAATHCGYSVECLPFTGMEVVTIAIFGIALVVTGWWFRHVSRDKKDKR